MSVDAFSTATAMRDALATREVSPAELVALHAGRIARYNVRRAQEAAEALESSDPFARADSAGMAASAGSYLGWFGFREALRQSYRDFFCDADIWIAPANITNAFHHDARAFPDRRLVINNGEVDYMHQCFYAGMATLPGQPSTAFPVNRTPEGLPVGLQAIGPYLEDLTPIGFTRLLAREIGGFTPPPDFVD